MFIKNLSVVNFKNYEEATFDFSPQINCLVGDNGSGKTNILDAIYYLGNCKSYFNPIDKQNIRHEEKFFVLSANFKIDDRLDKINCGVKIGQKKVFKRNDKIYDRLTDHIGKYPVVIITPNDIDLIKEGSEIRRKFFDSIIAQNNKTFLNNLINYNKVLLQRNNLLKHFAREKTFQYDSLEIWDLKLAELGEKIHLERKFFEKQFNPIFNNLYQHICGELERGTIVYTSDCSSNSFIEILNSSLQKDRILQRTSKGIHKDEYRFEIDSHSVKKFGSQGQQKSFLIALKLAQFLFIKEHHQITPILLLDDIFDKIDDKRVSHLMKLVNENTFKQIFITDTHHGRIPELFASIESEMKIFQIEKGHVLIPD